MSFFAKPIIPEKIKLVVPSFLSIKYLNHLTPLLSES